MANEGGVNQFQGFQPEQPYGTVKRLQELVSQAPLPPNSALNSPNRAKRQATRPAPAGQPASSPQQPVAPQPAPVEQPYPQRLAGILQAIPGADGALPNLTWLAQQAAKEAGG